MPSADENAEPGSSPTRLGGRQNGPAPWKTVEQFCKKWKHKSTAQASKPTPRYLPKRDEDFYLHKKLHTSIFSGLFIIAPNRKQPKTPSTSKRSDKPWAIYTLGY